jgi:ribosomal protein L18E
MGIDLKAGGRVKKNVRQTKTGNPYVRLFNKLYKFLARRTDSKFNMVILKRLNMARRNKPPLSLSKLVKNMKKKDGKVEVVTKDDDEKEDADKKNPPTKMTVFVLEQVNMQKAEEEYNEFYMSISKAYLDPLAYTLNAEDAIESDNYHKKKSEGHRKLPRCQDLQLVCELVQFYFCVDVLSCRLIIAASSIRRVWWSPVSCRDCWLVSFS